MTEAIGTEKSVGSLSHTEFGAGLFFVAAFCLFAYYSVPQLTFPFELRYGEGVVLDQVRRVNDAPGLYPPFDEPPYLIGNYPPVYPVVASLIPAPPSAPFFAGRLTSTASVLLSACLILLIVRRFASAPAGLIAGGAFLVLFEINEFGPLMRIDSLALALGLLGLFATTVSDSNPRVLWWRVFGAAAFFFSVYTRHSMLSFPIASYVLLFARAVHREDRWSAGWITLAWPLGLVAAGALAFLTANIAYDGEPFSHLIYLNRLPYQWPRVEQTWFASMFPWRYPLAAAALFALWPEKVDGNGRSTLARFLFTGALFIEIGLALVFLGWKLFSANLAPQDLLKAAAVFHGVWFVVVIGAVAGWTGIRERDKATRTVALFLLCGGASATLIGRVGSDVNYLFEYYAFISIAVGFGLARLRKSRQWGLIAIVALFVVGNVVTYPALRTARPARLEQIKGRQALLAKLVELPGKVLSQDPALLAMLGRPVDYQPFMYRQLSDNQIWDSDALVRAVRNKEFSAIIVVLHQPYAWMETVDGKRVPQFGPKVENAHNGFPKEVIAAYQEAYVIDPEVVVSEVVNDHYRELRYLLVPKEE